MTTGGPDMTFTKKDSADVSLSNSQDRITKDVWITRDDDRGIYNLVKEGGFNWGSSPSGTQWAYGLIDSVPLSKYDDWIGAVSNNTWGPSLSLNKKMAVHLTIEDLYFQVTFTQWTSAAQGGGFTYTRSGVSPWIVFLKKTDTVLVGQTDTIKFYIKSVLAQMPGLSEGWIYINSNDDANPKIKVVSKLTVTSIPDISDNVSPVNLGDVFQNVSSAYKLQILNNGLDILKISDIKFKSSFFTVTPKVLDIPAEGMAEVTVTFLPTAIKTYTDSITITSNDPDSANYIISFTGKGVLPSKINILPTDLTNSLLVNTTKNDTLILENQGANPLIYSIQFKINKVPVKFTKKDYANVNLPANQDRISDSVWITRGDFQGIYNIAKEKVYSGNPIGTLWAQGLTQENDMGNYNDWDNNNGGNRNFFNKWSSMYVEETKTFYDIFVDQWTVRASGGGFSWTRYEAPGWLKTTKSNGSIAAGKKDTIIIVFDANYINEGIYNADVVVKCNDPLKPSTTIPAQIKVTGVAEISSNVTDIDFSAVVLTKSATRKLSLINSGTDSLVISTIVKDSTQFSINKTAPIIIMPGKTLDVIVTFKPTALTTYGDTLDFTTNDPGNTLFRIPLTGIGAEPTAITLSKSTIVVKAVAGTTVNDTLYIKNTGKSDLFWTIKDITIPGTMPVIFTKKDSADYTLPVNQDRLADNVWITRAEKRGLFNIAVEGSFNWGSSPTGTSWTDEAAFSNNGWTDWRNAAYAITENRLREFIGKMLTLHVPVTEKYYDVVFNSWTALGMGGGFSYTRTEKPSIRLNTFSGSVAPDDSVQVIFTYNATKMFAGTYNYSMVLNCNDSTKTNITVPIKLILTGTPKINMPIVVDFGTIYKNIPDTMDVTVNSIGTDTLKVSSITLKGTDFKVSPASMIVLADQNGVIKVSITSAIVKDYIDTLIITSNDGTNATIKLAVKASVSALPKMVTSGLSQNIFLLNNVIYKDTLIISSTGDTTLTWDATYGPTWMTPSKLSGIILKTKKDSIFVTIDANTLTIGEYKDSVVLTSNDPSNAKLVIPVTLQINAIKLLKPLAPFSAKEGFGTKTVDLTGVFFGLNTPLKYFVGTNDTNMIKATLLGMTVTITGTGGGKAVMTVMALDTKGAYLYADMDLNINADPDVKSPAADISMVERTTQQINLDNVFTDLEGNAMTYTATSSNPAVLTVSLAGNMLTITTVAVGTANVTITAADAGMINPPTQDVFTVTVAVNALSADNNGVSIYPNPACGKAYIQLANTDQAQIIQLIGMGGEVLQVKQINAGTEMAEIDLTGIAPGVYVVKMINNDGTILYKLIVE